jgi:hypothetical protein
MLQVRIDHNSCIVSVVRYRPEPGEDGFRLSAVGWDPDYLCTGHLCYDTSVVRGPVINDQDVVHVELGLEDHGADGRLLVVGRYDSYSVQSLQIHPLSLLELADLIINRISRSININVSSAPDIIG